MVKVTPGVVSADVALGVIAVLPGTSLVELGAGVEDSGAGVEDSDGVVEDSAGGVDVVTIALVEVGDELVDVVLNEYVMQEHAELTAATLLSQLLKFVGIADGAVVVPARYSTQNVSASAEKRGSMRFL